MGALVKMSCVLENPKRIEAGFRYSFHEPTFRGFDWPRPAYSRALGRLSDDLKPHQPPALKFFHSYQQLLRIATPPTTQNQHHIDTQGIFAPEPSLRNGFTAYTRSPR
jgi:hypothetical protein